MAERGERFWDQERRIGGVVEAVHETEGVLVRYDRTVAERLPMVGVQAFGMDVLTPERVGRTWEPFSYTEDFMIGDGYEPKPPGGPGAGIDAEVCSRQECEVCGHEGLRYEPFSVVGSYVAFAVCPQCGFWTEF